MPIFDNLQPEAPDGLLALIKLFNDDPRPRKIDLGVGVYRDDTGRTPVLSVVKRAEWRLIESQSSKSYLGPDGDAIFVQSLAKLALGCEPTNVAGSVVGLQTPGGTGALRLGFELLRKANPFGRILVGRPTWANHEPMLSAVGLEQISYRYFNPTTQRIRIDDMLSAIEATRAGDAVLLHGCCHNPTGIDPTEEEWLVIARAIERRGAIAFVDMAYQGLGRGLEADRRGVDILLAHVPQCVVAVSCSKNFGLYRDRVGALYIAAGFSAAANIRSNLLSLARTHYSMPPDHGAAVVSSILADESLYAEWRAELEGMRLRIRALRARLANEVSMEGFDLRFVGGQLGMFSMLPLAVEQIERLRRDEAIYIAPSGRINVAGLQFEQVDALADALRGMPPSQLPIPELTA